MARRRPNTAAPSPPNAAAGKRDREASAGTAAATRTTSTTTTTTTATTSTAPTATKDGGKGHHRRKKNNAPAKAAAAAANAASCPQPLATSNASSTSRHQHHRRERSGAWPRFLVRSVVASVGAMLFKNYFISVGPAAPALCKLFNTGCPALHLSGYVHPDYVYLKQVFQLGFEQGDELGSGFAAYVDGKLVAELYGGYRDYTFTTPYDSQAIQQVFSSSKAVTSIAIAYMHDRGHLDIHAPVARYWPEFAQGGKENVTISDLLMHRGGLAMLDPDRAPTLEEVLDLDVLAAKIAGQPHNFGGNVVSAYHAVTRGWYLNEVVRRTHPQNFSLRDLMDREILPILSATGNAPSTAAAGPFEFYYGLPDALYDAMLPRLTILEGFSIPQLAFHALLPAPLQRLLGTTPLERHVFKVFAAPYSPSSRAVLRSGPVFPELLPFPHNFNRPEVWRSQAPSYAGLTNAKTLARFAALMANRGDALDPGAPRLLGPDAFAAVTEVGEPLPDLVIERNMTFTKGGFGVIEHVVEGEVLYGWAGAGGSMIVWNPELNFAFAYAMNFCHLQPLGDRRAHRLLKALSALVRRRRRLHNLDPDASALAVPDDEKLRLFGVVEA
ncbi:beta-lactamase/transpeptidase-like protein [Zopfochytrium polystomum]|nr:beta-lactamase/transpeptidase-like protein [Zopfochytrium polystomum]